MRIPLLCDLRLQQNAARALFLKTVLFLILFFTLDRGIGWILLTGLERYYGLNEPATVLCVGHSHTVLGIDKVALEQELGIKVAKFAVDGANTADRAMMIRHYFKRQPGSVRVVVYDVDAHTFTTVGLSSNSYELLFPFIDDLEMQAYIRTNCATEAEYVLKSLLHTARFNDLTCSLAFRGLLKKWTNLKFGTVNIPQLTEEIKEGRFRKIAFDTDNIEQFTETSQLVHAYGATLFLTYIPTIDILNQAEPEKYRRCMDIFNDYASTNSGVVFLNYNREFEHHHELFSDPIHLNREGQKRLTARLMQDLQRQLQNGSLVYSKTQHNASN